MIAAVPRPKAKQMMACSHETHLFAAIPGRQRTAEIDSHFGYGLSSPAVPASPVPMCQSTHTLHTPGTPGQSPTNGELPMLEPCNGLLHGSRLSLPCSFCRKHLIASNSTTRLDEPQTGKTLAPSAPGSHQDWPKPARFFSGGHNVLCVLEGYVPALQPLRAPAEASTVSMDALDVAISRPTSIDMGCRCWCRRLASTLTCFIMLSRDYRGSSGAHCTSLGALAQR
jgi:hypothetical protein